MKKKEELETKQKLFEEILLEVKRVTRVTTGGRRLSFRATILVGNKKGSVGIGIGKSVDVTGAIKKATHDAYKHISQVCIVGAGTVPYQICRKFKSAQIKLLPASAGTGIKAGSSVRRVLEIAGYQNILSKIVGSNNVLNNALVTIYALQSFKWEIKKIEAEEIIPENNLVTHLDEIVDPDAEVATSKIVIKKKANIVKKEDKDELIPTPKVVKKKDK